MKLMLIGGGDVGRGNTSYETDLIDKEIVKMSGKENPNFLFIGLASSFSDSYFDTMKKIYKELGCTPVYLKKKNIINNPDIVKDKINNADIIYICGGDSIKLVSDIKEYGIDELLVSAINRDCVVAGMSAGAILLAKDGYSDSLILRGESDKYSFVSGLGICDISICPHYNENTLKNDSLYDAISGNDKLVYGIENCACIKVVDDNYSVITSNNTSVYKITNKDNLEINKM